MGAPDPGSNPGKPTSRGAIMLYVDKVYGSVKIEEPVLIELMDSDALKRLKGINQYGSWCLLRPEFNTTRFEHSVGVMLLLKRLGASLNEQIGGLIHDVSHTAFSHTLDFVYGMNEEQNTHEKFYKKIISKSQIPDILEKNGIALDDVLNANTGLLEKDLPDMCADRIDYALRDLLVINEITKNEIKKVLDGMVVNETGIAFNNAEIAKFFAGKFMHASRTFWTCPVQTALYRIFSEAVNIALSEKLISGSDIFLTDRELYKKLENCGNSEITQKLDMISKLSVEENREQYDMHIKTKIRYIDPKVLSENKMMRLSEMDASYRKQMKAFIDKISEGFFIRIKK